MSYLTSKTIHFVNGKMAKPMYCNPRLYGNYSFDINQVTCGNCLRIWKARNKVLLQAHRPSCREAGGSV